MSQPLDVFGGPLSGITLVEASAGTGKTWAICGLVARLVAERGLPIGQILVVTFTNAATAELRQRIRERLTKVLSALRGDDDARKEARKDVGVSGLLDALAARGDVPPALIEQRVAVALASFDEAPICTIHSFCQRALAEAPLAAGAPLSQTLLLDDAPLREQVALDFWRCWVADAPLPPGLAELMVAKKDGPALWAQWLEWQAQEPLTRIEWPADIDDDSAADAWRTAAALRGAHEGARAAWPPARRGVSQAVEAARQAGRLNNSHYKTATGTRAAREAWDAVLSGSEPFGKIHRDQQPALPRFASGRFQAKKGHGTVDASGFFTTAQTWLDARAAHDRALRLHRLRLLRRVLQEGPAALRQAKRVARAITFADMLGALFHELTESPRADALATALRARFPAALIDEFQDTDPLQWGIFGTLYGKASGAGPLVLVGDPKQSIYAFRQADLHTYLLARSSADRQTTLIENQRSTPALVAGLNALFSQRPDAFRQAGLEYQSVRVGQKPRPAWHDTSEAGPRAALRLWHLPEAALPKQQARELAAAATAREIARLLKAAAAGQIQHDDRALRAGDIAVLVRTHEQGAQMKEALRERGIGSVELSNASVFTSPDAEVLDHWLAAVLNAQREGLVRTALAGTAMGWTAQALFAADDALLDQIESLVAYRALWRQRGVAVMLRRWLFAAEGEPGRSSVAARLLAGADGERRLTNLLHLIELLQAQTQEQTSPEALHRWLQKKRHERSSDDTAQQRLESDRLLVQIVTIHRSKGLEYPLVFCPFLFEGTPPAPKKLEGRQYHEEHAGDGGDGGDEHGSRAVRDLRDDEELGSREAEALKARVRQALQAEAMRKAYVALTRAVQRCCVVVGPYTATQNSLNESRASPMQWLVNGDWAAFAAAAAVSAPGAIEVAPLPMPAADDDAFVPAANTAAPPTALPPPERLPRTWVLSSYSRLAHAARHEAAAQDHDAFVRAALASSENAEPVAEHDILRFPRGPSAGECLHAAFERAEFGDESTWPGAIAAALARFPQSGDNQVHQVLVPQMHGMLEQVLRTPLALDGARAVTLATVPSSRRLVELEFMLPGGTLRAEALQTLLQAHGETAPALAFHTLQGPLRGFIDLVFEHAGRYHVLDWKSNHLGDRPEHYAAPALEAAMAQHGYGLQRLVYVLALHRHLQQRLPDYEYEQHMGEALYLFVRGVRPQWPGAGVVAHRPPLALVEAFGRWLMGSA